MQGPRVTPAAALARRRGRSGGFDWPHERLIVLKLFMDESGNGNASQPLIVGVVELDEDADGIEKKIRDLHRDLSARRSLAGLPSFEKFRDNGFHSSTDPLEVSGPFTDLMRRIFFRTYMVTTNRVKFQNVAESELIELMYVKLLSDLSIRNRREAELLCFIEQSEEMKSILTRLPDNVAKQARKTVGQPISLPRLSTQMVGKRDYMSTAIIDYVMAAVSRWLRANRTTSAESYAYRSFKEIEPSISLLYSFEDGRISSRRDPLH
jgi:hypothetical protein